MQGASILIIKWSAKEGLGSKGSTGQSSSGSVENCAPVS